jgi:hypothetical protein
MLLRWLIYQFLHLPFWAIRIFTKNDTTMRGKWWQYHKRITRNWVHPHWFTCKTSRLKQDLHEKTRLRRSVRTRQKLKHPTDRLYSATDEVLHFYEYLVHRYERSTVIRNMLQQNPLFCNSIRMP